MVALNSLIPVEVLNVQDCTMAFAERTGLPREVMKRNDDGSINVTEYNNAYATQLYSGDSHFGDFGARQIPASEVWRYNYIHFD